MSGTGAEGGAMGQRPESANPQLWPCFDCGAPAVVFCSRCDRPVCLMHCNKRVLRWYRSWQEPLIRFHCDECMYRYSAYVWPIAIICMMAVVIVLYLGVIFPW